MSLRCVRVELDLPSITVDWIYRAITHGGDISMKLRILSTIAAIAVMTVGVQHVAAQQMSPYAMGYPQVAPMGYPAAYAPAVPPQFDVRQAAALSGPTQTAAACSECGGAGCSTCDPCNVCGGVTSCWCHCVSVWGEYLYLRPRNAEVAYGVPIDGAIIPSPVNPVQVGRIGMVDPDFSSGIRFGVSYVLDGNSSVTAQYTWFESNTEDQVDTQALMLFARLSLIPAPLRQPKIFCQHGPRNGFALTGWMSTTEPCWIVAITV